jgi:Domain of unknown function DUF29
MAVIAKTLYGIDFVEWSAQTAALLRQRRFDEIDIENVAEEIRSLGDSELKGALSQLRRLLMHLIKQKIQPERDGPSWRASIRNARSELIDAIRVSPSLRRKVADELPEIYRRALDDARYETGLAGAGAPEECPFTLDRLIEGDPMPLHL